MTLPTPGPAARLARSTRCSLLTASLLVTLGAGLMLGRASAGAPLLPAGHVAAAGASIVVPDSLQRPDLVQPFNDLFKAYQVVTTDSYYAPHLDPKALIYAAANGLLTTGTGDAHTLFLSPSANAAVQASSQGSFEGIGAYVELTTRGISIIPLAGSPAARSGLHAGDLIVRINGQDITALTEDQDSALLRGVAGSTVTLGIQRMGTHGIFQVVVTRARITVPDVTSRMIGTIAYLQVTQFGDKTTAEVLTALQRLLAQRPSGLVLDLRDNPGGYVATAVEINSQFLPTGDIVLWEQNAQHQLDAPLRTQAGGLATAATLPMAVLVNDGTASAAEITAGALRENGRARIIGIPTYGKGSVQQEYSQPDNSSLRVTVRLWLTPHKHLIQGHGITPDIELDSPVSDGTARDAQLARAIRLLTTGR